MIHFKCRCGNTLYFENSICLQCRTPVGYEVAGNGMIALDEQCGFVRCLNGTEHGVCNWVIPGDAASPLCPACQLNRTIPNLQIDENRNAWFRLESAKRRVVYTLWSLGIPPMNRIISPDHGLAFDFLEPQPDHPVLTAHEHGVIILNIREADDAYREKQRQAMGEPYRTLVGHFRHELGHYYWDRFFEGRAPDDPDLVACRDLFGDDTIDYDAALQKHHQNGPPADWAADYISAYATCHPWEDWAETWAQYLHIVDAEETAQSFGWRSENVPIPVQPFSDDIVPQNGNEDAAFVRSLNAWSHLSPAINEIAASLGHSGVYPFVLSDTIARKLHFVNNMVKKYATQMTRPQPVQAPPSTPPMAPAAPVQRAA
jgi:hypothetical protein